MPTQNNTEGKFLAIDFGQSKVGLALADAETKISFAYKTLNNDKDFFQKLAEIIKEENVKNVIIGVPAYIYPHTKRLPKKMSSKQEKRHFGVGVNKEEVEYAGETLGKKIKESLPFVEIFYHNEMFTTKMAQKNLIEKGIKGVKKFDDQEAARIILQSWLDKNFKI